MEDFKLCCRVHLETSSSDSADSDELQDFDEAYMMYRPPPLEYETIKDKIVKITPSERNPCLTDSCIKPDEEFSSTVAVKGKSKNTGDDYDKDDRNKKYTKAYSLGGNKEPFRQITTCSDQDIPSDQKDFSIDMHSDIDWPVIGAKKYNPKYTSEERSDCNENNSINDTFMFYPKYSKSSPTSCSTISYNMEKYSHDLLTTSSDQDIPFDQNKFSIGMHSYVDWTIIGAKRYKPNYGNEERSDGNDNNNINNTFILYPKYNKPSPIVCSTISYDIEKYSQDIFDTNILNSVTTQPSPGNDSPSIFGVGHTYSESQICRKPKIETLHPEDFSVESVVDSELSSSTSLETENNSESSFKSRSNLSKGKVNQIEQIGSNQNGIQIGVGIVTTKLDTITELSAISRPTRKRRKKLNKKMKKSLQQNTTSSDQDIPSDQKKFSIDINSYVDWPIIGAKRYKPKYANEERSDGNYNNTFMFYPKYNKPSPNVSSTISYNIEKYSEDIFDKNILNSVTTQPSPGNDSPSIFGVGHTYSESQICRKQKIETLNPEDFSVESLVDSKLSSSISLETENNSESSVKCRNNLSKGKVNQIEQIGSNQNGIQISVGIVTTKLDAINELSAISRPTRKRHKKFNKKIKKFLQENTTSSDQDIPSDQKKFSIDMNSYVDWPIIGAKRYKPKYANEERSDGNYNNTFMFYPKHNKPSPNVSSTISYDIEKYSQDIFDTNILNSVTTQPSPGNDSPSIFGVGHTYSESQICRKPKIETLHPEDFSVESLVDSELSSSISLETENNSESSVKSRSNLSKGKVNHIEQIGSNQNGIQDIGIVTTKLDTITELSSILRPSRKRRTKLNKKMKKSLQENTTSSDQDIPSDQKKFSIDMNSYVDWPIIGANRYKPKYANEERSDGNYNNTFMFYPKYNKPSPNVSSTISYNIEKYSQDIFDKKLSNSLTTQPSPGNDSPSIFGVGHTYSESQICRKQKIETLNPEDVSVESLVDSKLSSSISLETEKNSESSVKSTSNLSKGKVNQIEQIGSNQDGIQIGVGIVTTKLDTITELSAISRPTKKRRKKLKKKIKKSLQENTCHESKDSVNNQTEIEINSNSRIKKYTREELLDVASKMVHDNRFLKECCSIPESVSLPCDYSNVCHTISENSVSGKEFCFLYEKLTIRMALAEERGLNGNNCRIKEKAHHLSPTLLMFNINECLFGNIQCFVRNYLVIYQALLMTRLLNNQIKTGDLYLVQKDEYSYDNILTRRVQFEVIELLISHQNMIRHTNRLKYESYYTVLFANIIASMNSDFHEYYNIKFPSAISREYIHRKKNNTKNIVVSNQLFQLLSCLEEAPLTRLYFIQYILEYDSVSFEGLELRGDTLYDTCKFHLENEEQIGNTESETLNHFVESNEKFKNEFNIEALNCKTLLESNLGKEIEKYTKSNNIFVQNVIQNILELIETSRNIIEKNILKTRHIIYENNSSNSVLKISRVSGKTEMLDLNDILQNHNEYGSDMESGKIIWDVVKAVTQEISIFSHKNEIYSFEEWVKIISYIAKNKNIFQAQISQHNDIMGIRELVKNLFYAEKLNSMLQNSKSAAKFVCSLEDTEVKNISAMCYIHQNNGKITEIVSEEAKTAHIKSESDNISRNINSEDTILDSFETIKETNKKYVRLETDSLQNNYIDNILGLTRTFNEAEKNNLIETYYMPCNSKNVLAICNIRQHKDQSKNVEESLKEAHTTRQSDSMLQNINNDETILASVETTVEKYILLEADISQKDNNNENIGGLTQSFNEAEENNMILETYKQCDGENILGLPEISGETDKILETDNNSESYLEFENSFDRSGFISMVYNLILMYLLFILFINFLCAILSYLYDNLFYILSVLIMFVINFIEQ